MPTDLLTLSAAARELGVSAPLVKKWLQQGRLKGEKPGGTSGSAWVIRRANLVRPKPLPGGRPKRSEVAK